MDCFIMKTGSSAKKGFPSSDMCHGILWWLLDTVLWLGLGLAVIGVRVGGGAGLGLGD